MLSEIRKVFCFVAKSMSMVTMLIATDSNLQIIKTDGQQTISETKEDIVYQPIDPILSIDGTVYLVEQEISSQSSNVVQVKLEFDMSDYKWVWSRKTIFSTGSNTILAIQFDQESVQMADYNYTRTHELQEINPLDSVNQMYIFCSTLEMIKIKQEANGKFREVLNLSLQSLESL